MMKKIHLYLFEQLIIITFCRQYKILIFIFNSLLLLVLYRKALRIQQSNLTITSILINFHLISLTVIN